MLGDFGSVVWAFGSMAGPKSARERHTFRRHQRDHPRNRPGSAVPPCL